MGFFSSIAKAVSGVVKGVGKGIGKVAGTVYGVGKRAFPTVLSVAQSAVPGGSVLKSLFSKVGVKPSDTDFLEEVYRQAKDLYNLGTSDPVLGSSSYRTGRGIKKVVIYR